MAERLRRVWFVISSRRDSTLSAIWMIVSGIGVAATLWPGAAKTIALLRLIFAGWCVIFLSWLIVVFRQACQMNFTDFWPTTEGAHNWLRKKLKGDPPELTDRLAIRTLALIGVACTDIAYLFEEVVNGVAHGLNIDVFMVNPDNSTLMSALKDLEPEHEVKKKVQAPMYSQLKRLESRYRPMNDELAGCLHRLGQRLDQKDFKDHAECIRVCEDAWILAGVKGYERQKSGAVRTYLLNELPWARQWALNDKALVYSVYAGHPGVGVDNPVFRHSIIDGREGKISRRASIYVDELRKKCGGPHKHVP